MNKSENNKVINVVDDMMGSGKSTWAIQYMLKKQKDGERFIYVTPYLTEVERVKKECGFSEPEEDDGGKLQAFKKLLSLNKNVATTHALFKMLDEESLDLLSVGYTLILDEVLEVVEETTIKKGDLENMLSLGILKYDDENHIVMGNEIIVREKAEVPNEYQTISKNLLRHNLEIIDGEIKIALIWLFPIDVINVFDEVFILTFMFDGYPMKGYLDAHKIKQKKNSVLCKNPEDSYENRRYELKDYKYPNIKEISYKIEIVSKGKINDIGVECNSFTYSWWNKLLKDKTHLDWITLRKNINNFLVNFASTTSKKRILWTTFTNCRSSLYSASLTDDNFVANNIRATNDYREMDTVIYLVDKRYNPVIHNWFRRKNLKIDEDLYALGEMIQMIWRSAIRDGNSIKIYIPSKRMRNLFLKFLKGVS